MTGNCVGQFKAEQQAWEELRVRHQTRMEQQKTQVQRSTKQLSPSCALKNCLSVA